MQPKGRQGRDSRGREIWTEKRTQALNHGGGLTGGERLNMSSRREEQ